MPVVTIDDKGLTYSHVLMAAAPNMVTSYSGRTTDFMFDGISPIDGLRFGGTWYFIETTPAWRGYGTANTSPFNVTLPGAIGWANSNYTVVQGMISGGRCWLSGGYVATGYCGQKIKVTAPVGQRLTAYNDLESVQGSTSDNTMTRNLEIFVR